MRTLIALLVLSSAAAAQSPTFSSRREVVRVDVLVSTNGQPLKGLRPSDFQVRDNGRWQQVELATFEEVPLNVVLAFDMSESVAGERLAHLRSAGRSVLRALEPDDRASLVTFSHLVAQRTPLTTNTATVLAELDSVEGSGGTALFDGMCASILLSGSAEGRSLVIVFSDGMDTASWLSPRALIDTARRSDAVVYSVSVGRTDESASLREVSEATGGSLFEVESTQQLDRTFLQIFNEFRYRYLVSYSPQGVDEIGWHRLQVDVKREGATVKARPGYQKGS